MHWRRRCIVVDVINTCATCATPCWASVIRHVGLVCYAMLKCATPFWATLVCYAMWMCATPFWATQRAQQRVFMHCRGHRVMFDVMNTGASVLHHVVLRNGHNSDWLCTHINHRLRQPDEGFRVEGKGLRFSTCDNMASISSPSSIPVSALKG